MRASLLSRNIDELRLVLRVLPPLFVEKLTITQAAMFRCVSIIGNSSTGNASTDSCWTSRLWNFFNTTSKGCYVCSEWKDGSHIF